MATYPEELDVFSIPHSRMKHLVAKYYYELSHTNFTSAMELKTLLQNLRNTFNEFKQHEKIENEFIMSRLKSKLQALSIHNTAVCNCHKDNRLSDVLVLVQHGYDCMMYSNGELNKYASELKHTLESFTKDFIPHMKEEEEVFQPLLMKYFSYDELCDLKKRVIEEHIKQEEKHVKDLQENDQYNKTFSDDDVKFLTEDEIYSPTLPPEIVLKIFSKLGPQELGCCAQVCKQWSEVAMDHSLWTSVLPVRWAKGDWSFYSDDTPDDDDDDGDDLDEAVLYEDEGEYIVMDEDADKDESEDINSNSSFAALLAKESKLLKSITKYLLAKVGDGVRSLNLANCKALTSDTLRRILMYCPNLENLNLAHTKISDSAFKGTGKKQSLTKLKFLKLTGCTKITDGTLVRLSRALGRGSCNRYKRQNDISKCDDNFDRTLKIKNTSDIICDANVNYCSDENIPKRRSRQNDNQCNNIDITEDGVVVLNCSDDTYCDNVNNSWKRTCGICYECPYRNRCCSSSGESDGPEFDMPNWGRVVKSISFSGCYMITDLGIKALSTRGGLPKLNKLDLSGCPKITGPGLDCLVAVAPQLIAENFCYCDNIVDGPMATSANGCRNVGSSTRACCRSHFP